MHSQDSWSHTIDLQHPQLPPTVGAQRLTFLFELNMVQIHSES